MSFGRDALDAPRGEPRSRAYDAFLSYSRRDSEWAERIQSAIESYRVPGPRTLRVFRDTTDLNLSPALEPALRRALEDSRHLLILCSPSAAASQYVRGELVHFVSGREGAELLWILLKEDAERSIRPLLDSSGAETPFYLDLRSLARLRWVRTAALQRELLPLLATLVGVTLDDLVRREEARRRRSRWRLFVAAAVILAVFAVSTIAAGIKTSYGVYAEATVATLGAEDLVVYGGVYRVAFAEERPLLASGANGGAIGVWDLASPNQQPRVVARVGSIRGVAWDTRDASILATTGSLLVKVNPWEEPTERGRFAADHQLKALHPLAESDHWLVGGTTDGHVLVVDIESGLLVSTWETGRKNLDGVWPLGNAEYLVHELNGFWFAVGGATGSVRELPLGASAASPPLYDEETRTIAMSELTDTGSQAVVVDVADGERVAELSIPAGYPPSALARHGDTLAVGQIHGKIYLFSIRSGRRIDDDRMSVPGQPQSMGFSPDGRLLAVGYKDLGSSEGGIRVFERPVRLFGLRMSSSSF